LLKKVKSFFFYLFIGMPPNCVIRQTTYVLRALVFDFVN